LPFNSFHGVIEKACNCKSVNIKISHDPQGRK
jgi:hypothetical protein